jgi:adenosyl cobinamide kinase/adenosyl cobinamide phosphate guanylyltransferase
MWLANVVERGLEEEAIERQAEEAAAVVAAREPLSVAVSNEVGLGVVPVSKLGRRYRDLLGRVNAIWAEAASEAAFVAAGRLVPLARPESVLGSLRG